MLYFLFDKVELIYHQKLRDDKHIADQNNHQRIHYYVVSVFTSVQRVHIDHFYEEKVDYHLFKKKVQLFVEQYFELLL